MEKQKWIVPFVAFSKNYHSIKPEIDEAIFRCLEQGDFVLRDDVKKFEENFADFVGTKYAIGVNSGTDALFFSLKAAGIKAGDEVITVAYTFFATVEAIIRCGAKSILVDVREDFLMDIDALKKAVTPNTRAIIPVHLAGAMCDMEKLIEFAAVNNLMIIEDACQALGAEFDGERAGSIGLTGCFSFFPAKILGGYGDGGAVTTNNQRIAQKIRLMRDHCRKSKNEIICKDGHNSRLDNLQAAVLDVKLKYLPRWIQRRREIAKIYDKGLKGVEEIILPRSDIYQDYVIIIAKRDELFEYLKEKGIETLIGEYPFPGVTPLYNTNNLNKTALRLPIVPELTNKQVEYVIKKIKEFYGKKV